MLWNSRIEQLTGLIGLTEVPRDATNNYVLLPPLAYRDL